MELLRQLGLDAAVVVAIVFATQIIKTYINPNLKPWLTLIPVILGIILGTILAFNDGWIAIVRNGFVYGAVATWLYSFGTKLLGIPMPGDQK